MSPLRIQILVACVIALAACSKSEAPPETEAQTDVLETGDDLGESAVEEAVYVEEMNELAAMVPGDEREVIWDALSQEEARDSFTYSNYFDVRITHVDFDLAVDFERKVLAGVAELTFRRRNRSADRLVLDTKQLNISSVEAYADGRWRDAEYEIGPHDPVMGSRFEIALPKRARKVRVAYETSPEAEGLQWLSPEQTAGKAHPYLFTQFQPLLARSMAPLQDTPAVRITYDAHITTPPELIALMSARQDPSGDRDGDYQFKMIRPVPSYLLALVVGDIEFKRINNHIGVFAERYILDAAAEEFEDTPKMETAIAKLYGPYRWGRYDLIVMPPSFTFGGMENPRLSFVTPTLIAGDKSLTNVVAHELAHSWSGNLVTNATWRDAWLNEGFTSYVENRTMEALYGEERALMERALDKASLLKDVAAAARPELTALKMPADITDPDVGFTDVSYAGGMFFLKFLEERFGRKPFDAFLRSYFDEFAFKSITTEDFLTYFEDNLWADDQYAVSKSEIDAWIYHPGFPDTIEDPQSSAFEKVASQLNAWIGGGEPGGLETSGWSTHEWLYFIDNLPNGLTLDQLAALDALFNLSHSQNAEIAAAWYLKVIPVGYEPAFEPIEAFLMQVGRGKFIYPLYTSLIEDDRREWADALYERARPGYHPTAQRRIDAIFGNAIVEE